MAKKSVKTHEVSALRMPGFNAEASLYGSPVVYHSSVGSGGSIGAVNRGVTPVVPSLFIGPHAPDCPFPGRVIGHWCVCYV